MLTTTMGGRGSPSSPGRTSAAPRSGHPFTGVVQRLAEATCTQHAHHYGAGDYQQEKKASGEHGACRHQSWSGPSPCCIQIRKLSRSSARPTHQYAPPFRHALCCAAHLNGASQHQPTKQPATVAPWRTRRSPWGACWPACSRATAAGSCTRGSAACSPISRPRPSAAPRPREHPPRVNLPCAHGVNSSLWGQ